MTGLAKEKRSIKLPIVIFTINEYTFIIFYLAKGLCECFLHGLALFVGMTSDDLDDLILVRACVENENG